MTKDYDQYLNDLSTYGVHIKVMYVRAWWNPMRWIKGKCSERRIDPRKYYKGL